MTEKRCTKCGEFKPVDAFGIRRDSKDGLSFQCRVCVRARNDAYYLADKAKSATQRAENYAKNRDRLLQYRRDYYGAKREQHLARMQAHKERNLEAYLERCRNWARNNRDKINSRMRRRWEVDMTFRHKEVLRKTLRGLFSRLGTKKEGRTVEIVGYTAATFAQRMEYQFQPGMSWENYGEWQIDHKIPVDHFIKKGEWRPEIIHALCNLQPLWAADNLRKRHHLPPHLKERYK